MNDPVVTVMVGLPASGKTKKAEMLAIQHNAIVLSSDTYRLKLYGNEADQTHNNEVFKALYDDMRNYIIAGRHVIIDATNTTLKSRSKIFQELHRGDFGKKYTVKTICYIVNTPIEQCIERDDNRERKVGKDIIWKFARSFQCPHFFEGFDMIEISNVVKFSEDALGTLSAKMCDFNQNNPHHLYSLGEHCSKLAGYYFDNDTTRYVSGLLHDVGKLFTQNTDEKGISHYYNHDSIGAYYLLSHLEFFPAEARTGMLLDILFFVNYHMRAHNDFRQPKAEKKYRSLFGDKLYDMLIDFAENDKKASGTYNDYEKIKEDIK